MKVYSDLVRELDYGHQAVLALLDMTAAFDTVDHSILLQRLYHAFRITDGALDWFTSYLSNRSQSVRLHDGAWCRMVFPMAQYWGRCYLYYIQQTLAT